jgi:type VI secretion system protein ImpM
VNRPVGWYGKLPALGDFAGRRLPAEFVARWDDWLQRGMARSRSDLGERWMELYLTFPVWRFIVPGDKPEQFAWCGVLLPSVDRVGRCFPLTICRRLDHDEARGMGIAAIDDELGHLAEAGMQALDGIAPDDLDKALDTFTPAAASESAPATPVISMPSLLPGGAGGVWPLNGPLAGTLARTAELAVLASLAGHSLWWSPAAEERAGVLRCQPTPLGDELLTQLISVG